MIVVRIRASRAQTELARARACGCAMWFRCCAQRAWTRSLCKPLGACESTIMSDSWHTATHKRKSGQRVRNAVVHPSPVTPSYVPSSGSAVSRKTASNLDWDASVVSDDACAGLLPIIQQLRKCHAELFASDFLRSFERALRFVEFQDLYETCRTQEAAYFSFERATRLVVYGLGSPSSGKVQPT